MRPRDFKDILLFILASVIWLFCWASSHWSIHRYAVNYLSSSRSPWSGKDFRTDGVPTKGQYPEHDEAFMDLWPTSHDRPRAKVRSSFTWNGYDWRRGDMAGGKNRDLWRCPMDEKPQELVECVIVSPKIPRPSSYQVYNGELYVKSLDQEQVYVINAEDARDAKAKLAFDPREHIFQYPWFHPQVIDLRIKADDKSGKLLAKFNVRWGHVNPHRLLSKHPFEAISVMKTLFFEYEAVGAEGVAVKDKHDIEKKDAVAVKRVAEDDKQDKVETDSVAAGSVAEEKQDKVETAAVAEKGAAKDDKQESVEKARGGGRRRSERARKSEGPFKWDRTKAKIIDEPKMKEHGPHINSMEKPMTEIWVTNLLYVVTTAITLLVIRAGCRGLLFWLYLYLTDFFTQIIILRSANFDTLKFDMEVMNISMAVISIIWIASKTWEREPHSLLCAATLHFVVMVNVHFEHLTLWPLMTMISILFLLFASSPLEMYQTPIGAAVLMTSMARHIYYSEWLFWVLTTPVSFIFWLVMMFWVYRVCMHIHEVRSDPFYTMYKTKHHAKQLPLGATVELQSMA